MKILTITAMALIGLYVGSGVALNSAADLAMRLWSKPVQAQVLIDQSGGQPAYPGYQLQPAANPQQPASVTLQARPSHVLQP